MFQEQQLYQKILSKWCNNIDLEFDISMLKWKKGAHSQDGIWWKHWYDNVITTTHFQKLESNQPINHNLEENPSNLLKINERKIWID